MLPRSMLHARLLVHLLQDQKSGIRLAHGLPNLPHPPSVVSLGPEHEKEARAWLTSFRNARSIPKHQVLTHIEKISGADWDLGYLEQNVNKLSTKVTARCNLDAPWIPLWTRESLMRSPYYVKSTHSLLMTSSASRSQASNVDDVLAKLHTLVAESAASLIKGSPTQEQRQRVAALRKADDARRRLQKDKRGAAKRSRSSKDWD